MNFELDNCVASEQVPLVKHKGKQTGTLTAKQPGAWASQQAGGRVRDARCKMVNFKVEFS